MLISDFAKATGLSPDTIRFYIRRGLITPETGSKGGRNPYQIFTVAHVREARLIRMAKSLGISLKEISGISKEYRDGLVTEARSIELMSRQLERLERKRVELDSLTGCLRAKIDWLKAGSPKPEPDVWADVAQAPFTDGETE